MVNFSLKDLEILAHGNAAALASLISTSILYPCENIKTRMHIVSKKDDDLKKQDLEGVVETIKRVLQEDGVAGFYKGITPLLLGNYISYGVYFFWYEMFKRKLQIKPEDTFAILKPSFMSAVMTTFITNPFWVIQSKQTFSKNKQNFLQTCKKMMNDEGIKGFYKGLSASLALVINPIIQFLVYEILKRKFKNNQNQALVHFLSGALSKAIATFLTYPYQVLRTYAHLDENKTNYVNLLRQITKQLGVLGLYRGFTPKLVQTVLNSAFMLMFYEYFVKIIQKVVTQLMMRMKIVK